MKRVLIAVITLLTCAGLFTQRAPSATPSTNPVSVLQSADAGAPPPVGSELPKLPRAFIADNCIDCHGPDTARAGFRIDLLSSDFNAGNDGNLWKKVLDKLSSGKMPPADEHPPDAKDKSAMLSWIADNLHETELAAQQAGGQVPMRRMNRVEYANTVRDLFSLEEGFARRIERELPQDGKVGGFDRGAVGLFMDDSQLDQYMNVADLVLDQAVFTEKPTVKQMTYDAAKAKYVHGIGVCYKDSTGKVQEDNPTPQFVSQLTDPLSLIPIDGFQDWRSKVRRYVPHGPFAWAVKNGGIEYLAGVSEYGGAPPPKPVFCPEDWARSGVSRDGWYRMRIQAGAFKGEGSDALKQIQLAVDYCPTSLVQTTQSVMVDAPLDAPRVYEFLMYLQTGPAGTRRSFSIAWDNGNKNIIAINPQYWDVQWKTITIAGDIEQAIEKKKPAEQIAALRKKSDEAAAAALENRKTFPGPYWVYVPNVNLTTLPRLWIGKMEWEGPIVDWPPRGFKTLFFDGEDRQDDNYVREIFTRFLPLAYRRPVTGDEVDKIVNWTLAARASQGLSFKMAVREGVKNVLCSPAFLYLGSEGTSPVETKSIPAAPQPLDGWQLASRMSYLLWSSVPDEQLTQLSQHDQLRDPTELRTQVKRMLADPKAQEFVRSFAGQWLGVRNFDNGNPPDRRYYRDYDDALKDSAKREPVEFFGQVLKDDLPVTNFIDSDFLMVNERLAKQYGIAGVEGEAFRRVPAPADDRRGGVLGMTGILTYLADGTRTLPVRRANWVLDTFWNRPKPPPPPNAGELPAIKDKNLTVRERLGQHRNSENCASCHAEMDSFGLALENYDAIGTWRDRQNGEGMRGDKSSPALDVSGTLPDGSSFKTLQEFKAALLAHKNLFIRGFTEKMLCYALGRPIKYSDHLAVEQIDAEASKQDYRFQEFIQAIVLSTDFQTR